MQRDDVSAAAPVAAAVAPSTRPAPVDAAVSPDRVDVERSAPIATTPRRDRVAVERLPALSRSVALAPVPSHGAPVVRRAAAPHADRAAGASAAKARPRDAVGSAVAAGVAAAAAAGSAGSGPAGWLLLALSAPVAVFFSRLISRPALSRPAPFISLLERPG